MRTKKPVAKLLAGLALALASTVGVLAQSASADVLATVGKPAKVAPIPPGFLGFAFEYRAVLNYAGGSSQTFNPLFEQLIRDLVPGQSPVIRIGGDSTDHTWWPAPGVALSPGLTFELTPDWMATVGRLARDLNAHKMLGINLEANQPKLAEAEANALLAGIGRRYITSLQIGNEPSLYAQNPWYMSENGAAVHARARETWNVHSYLRDYARIRRVLPNIPLTGPDLGDLNWMHSLRKILKAEPRIDMVTYHRYGGNRCHAAPGSHKYPSVHNLLSTFNSRGLARTVKHFVAIARAKGDGFRVDELNTIACGGQSGVSDTFASALWVLDTVFALAGAGVDGVNIQTFPEARYRLFGFDDSTGRWVADVAPEYYGLLMFTQAAPPGAELMGVRVHTDSSLRIWATRVQHTIRVVLINDSGSMVRHVRIPLVGGTTGTLERLAAPSPYATTGVTLGGRSFASPSRTGRLRGTSTVSTVNAGNGVFHVVLPPASAALLTVKGASPPESGTAHGRG